MTMKKRIFKQKKIKNSCNMDRRKVIYRNTRHRAGKAAMALVLSGLLAGVVQPVYGREALAGTASGPSKVVVTDIYHRHIGDASQKGGCYQDPVAHVHQGDVANGGACFQKEVKHVHEGDETTGGGCYTRPLLHAHEGNDGQDGACYSAIYHVHEGGCYQNQICTIRYTKGDVAEIFTAECDTHGETNHERANGTGSHKDCDEGEEGLILEYCQICGPMSYSYHTYPTVVCGIDTDQPVGYEKVCGKEEGDIEGYETGCNLAQGQTESYERTCEKTVEGYDRNCALTEDIPCGRLTITNETGGQEETVTVSVKFDDLSGGKLKPSQPPFFWQDENGNRIGNGDRIEVKKNGNYTVELKLENRDVDEGGLKGSIVVDNVLEKPSTGEETTPSPSPSATPSPGKGEESASPSPEQTPGNGNQEGDGKEDKEEGGDGEEDPSPIPTTVPTPVQDPDTGTGDGGGQEGKNPSDFNKNTGLDKKNTADNEKAASPSPRVTIKKMTKAIEPEEKMEPALPQPEKKEVRQSGLSRFFAVPAVRVITAAAGTLLLLAGLLLLLLYLKKSVRLYNDDGEGGYAYLGRLAVRLEEEGYAVSISESAWERAFTNRYCIRPGLFRLGKGEQVLFVYKGEERISVSLAKEMIVVL